jgi:signal transduction histidine kinase
MQEAVVSFEQILTATLRMLRSTWKASTCIFLQLDDAGALRVRGADGATLVPWDGKRFALTEGVIARCVGPNQIVATGRLPAADPLAEAFNPLLANATDKFLLVPVTGQARVLGVLLLGPFDQTMNVESREAELRSAGALCAVLSAHWRLYEWISHFIPEVNHELRTPLTAVQGSIGMVLGGVFGQVGSEVREMLEMAQKGCERTVRAIEGYLNNQDVPKGKP